MEEFGNNNRMHGHNTHIDEIETKKHLILGVLETVDDFKKFKKLIQTLYDDYFQEHSIYNNFAEYEDIIYDLPVWIEYPETLLEYDNDDHLLNIFYEIDNCSLPALEYLKKYLKKYLLKHKNLPEEQLNKLKIIKEYINSRGSSDPLCLKFEDIEGVYDFNSLARLILYVKITGEKIHSHEDLHWTIDGGYFTDINASCLRFLFDCGIHVNRDKLSSMSNIVIDGVKSFKDSVDGEIKFTSSLILFLISYFEGVEEEYLIKEKIVEICGGIFKLSYYLSEINFSDPKIQNKLLDCKPEMFDENNLRFILGCLIPQNCENPFDEFVACNDIIDKIIEFREIVSGASDKQLKIEFPGIINETRDNELKTKLSIIETDESVQFDEFVSRLNSRFSKVDFSDPKILRELLTFSPEIFVEDNLNFFSKYYENLNDGTYNSLLEFNGNIGNISNYVRLSHYLPDVDFSDYGIKSKLLKCKSEIFDENILEFIFKYIILSNEGNKFDKFIFVNDYNINQIVGFYKLLYDNLDKNGNPLIFNRLKRWFPDIDSDPFKVQKLLFCKPEMFEEDNLNFIFEHFVSQDSNDPFDEFVACNDIIDNIVKFRGIINVNSDANAELDENENADSNHVENNESILFGKFISVFNSYFPNDDFSEPEILKKLLDLNPEMFYKNNIDLFFKYYICEDCSPSIYDYIACNDIVSDFNEVNLSLLDLLVEHFGLKRNVLSELIRFINSISGDGQDRDKYYSSFYTNLSETIEFFDQYFLSDGGQYNFKSLGFDISRIFQLSGMNRMEQLFYVVPGFDESKLSKVRSNQDSVLKNFAESFGKNEPFDSPNYGDLTDNEVEMINDLQSKIDHCNQEIDLRTAQIKALQDEISKLKKNKSGYENDVNKLKCEPYHRYEKEQNAKNTKNAMEKGKRRARCKSFFRNGINDDNFTLIFDNYFDIVFDGKYNDFIQSIPVSIIQGCEFIDKVISSSLYNDAPYLVFPLIKRLYKIRELNNDEGKLETILSLEYMFNIMSSKGYFGSFIYGLMSLNYKNRNIEFFKYILSKHGSMRACDKVKLLPYFSDIPFKSKDDLDQFIKDIVLEYGPTCLEPHYFIIARLYSQFGLLEYRFSRLGYDFSKYSEKYYNNCLNYFLSEETDIFTIYSKGSGELRTEEGIEGKQKFILGADIIDSKNIKCYLRTDPVAYHNQLNWYGNYSLGGGFLDKDDLSRRIYVYGKSKEYGPVYKKFYPVIEDILRKNYPDYEIVFGNPFYYH